MLSLAFVDCAKRGMPGGGPIDSLAPQIIRAIPPNYSTQFQGNEIRIIFDEYIKFKDLQQQLIISPPPQTPPTITPYTTARFINIKFNDTLLPNTTYSINFGNSIVDNNEENPKEFFKFVFSTGNYLDSLSLSGTLSDALNREPDNNIIVMLYEKNEHFTDSTIFKQKPKYIANNRNNPNNFEFQNLKEGNYQLIAIKDQSNTLTFNPQTDKIAFIPQTISLPTQNNYHLTLFKETPKYQLVRTTTPNKNQVQFAFQGLSDSLTITPLNNSITKHTLTKEPEKDTLNFWHHTPNQPIDTLAFIIQHKAQQDTLKIAASTKIADTLKISATKTGTLTPLQHLTLTANKPLIEVNPNNIKVIDRDSVNQPFTTQLNTYLNQLQLQFQKQEQQNYSITLFPEALTGFFGATNDTLNYTINTRAAEDYGFLTLHLTNPQSNPLIIQLITERGQVATQKHTQQTQSSLNFSYLTPGNYHLRIIHDANNNGKWDTGNFLKQQQPETVIHFPNTIEIRANWSINETFILE